MRLLVNSFVSYLACCSYISQVLPTYHFIVKIFLFVYVLFATLFWTLQRIRRCALNWDFLSHSAFRCQNFIAGVVACSLRNYLSEMSIIRRVTSMGSWSNQQKATRKNIATTWTFWLSPDCDGEITSESCGVTLSYVRGQIEMLMRVVLSSAPAAAERR